MLEFEVKKNFNIGLNLRAFLWVPSVYYDVFRDNWIIDLIYFYNKAAYYSYRLAEYLLEWIEKNSFSLTPNGWLWLKKNYMDKDLSKLPIAKEQFKLTSTKNLYTGERYGRDFEKLPVISDEFWYNKTAAEVHEWVKQFIMKNKPLFQINEMFETSSGEAAFRKRTLEGIIAKAKEIR